MTAHEKRELETVMRIMSRDLANMAKEMGLGAIMVRVIETDAGIVASARAHKRVGGLTLPTEVVGFRELVVDQ